jgi:serine/threonine-protein kinase
LVRGAETIIKRGEIRMPEEDSLGREYLLHEELGRGAMAVVRRATSRSGGPDLVAKLLRPELAGDRRIRDLFLREEAALRDLEHDSIVALRDLVVESGRLALVMEYVNGPNLRRFLADSGGRLPAGEVTEIGTQLAAALAVAHAHGVVHLDLKPENVLVVGGTQPTKVKISDFGVASLLLDAGQTGTAPSGGTPGYTAPELAAGGAATTAADVYALGVLLAEMLTGARPVSADSDLSEVPSELRDLVKGCPAGSPRRTLAARHRHPPALYRGQRHHRERRHQVARPARRAAP